MLFFNNLQLQPACLVIYVFSRTPNRRNCLNNRFFSTFCWPTVKREEKKTWSCKIYLIELKTLSRIFSLSCLHESKNSDNFLWIWTILKTRWLDVQILLNFFKTKSEYSLEATMNLCNGILFPRMHLTRHLSLLRSCLLIKISTCKPIYAKYRAWFSVLCPFLRLKGNRPEKTTKNTLKFFFRFATIYLPFSLLFAASSSENI